MSASRSALFVIDIQHELCGDASTEIPHAARIKHAGAQILSAARAHISRAREAGNEPDLEIVFVQHNDETPDDGTMLIGSKAWELYLSPRQADGDVAEPVVRKTVADTFESDPHLAADLKARNISHIVTFGLQSDFCVRATSKGARRADFNVTLLQGAHSTYNSEAGTAEQIERAIEGELKNGGIAVVPWEEWCEKLRG